MTDDQSLFDELNHRLCSRCGEPKPLIEFLEACEQTGV